MTLDQHKDIARLAFINVLPHDDLFREDYAIRAWWVNAGANLAALWLDGSRSASTEDFIKDGFNGLFEPLRTLYGDEVAPRDAREMYSTGFSWMLQFDLYVDVAAYVVPPVQWLQ